MHETVAQPMTIAERVLSYFLLCGSECRAVSGGETAVDDVNSFAVSARRLESVSVEPLTISDGLAETLFGDTLFGKTTS
jgi:hypothetical protein